MLLSPFLWRARRTDLQSGMLLGVVLFFCYLFQVEGLALTSSNRNAFICGLNVLVVPLLGILGGRLPERRIVVALALAVAGLVRPVLGRRRLGPRRHARAAGRALVRRLRQADGSPHPHGDAPDDA